MKKPLITAIILTFLGAMGSAVLAEGPGSCGKGKVWDSDQNKCVAKPRGSGSGSHSQ